MIKEMYDIGQEVYCIDYRCDGVCPWHYEHIIQALRSCDICKTKEAYVQKHVVLGIEIDGKGTYYQTDMHGQYHESLVFGSREAAEAEAEKQNRRNNND